MHILPNNHLYLKEVVYSWLTDGVISFYAPILNLSSYLKGKRDLLARNTVFFETLMKDERTDLEIEI